MDNNFFHRDIRNLARHFSRLGDFFYRVAKIALYLSWRVFSRRQSFLSETFCYKTTLGAFGHLEYWEEKRLFSEEIYFLTLILNSGKNCFGPLASFFYAGSSHLHSAYRGELLRWKKFLLEIVSIIVSSGEF